MITRRRPRGDDTEVNALLLTSLAAEAPRVLVNVENDDYGVVRPDVECSCRLAALGLRTRISDIRGISKVVAAGISLDGDMFDRLVEVELPDRSAAARATTSSWSTRESSGTTIVRSGSIPIST